MHYSLRQDHKRHKTITYIIVVFACCVVVTGCIAAFMALSRLHTRTSNATSQPKTIPSSIQSRVLFVGDTYWGRFMNQWSQASALKYAYPFSGLSTFHRETYDAWVANLECPTVPGVNQSPAIEDATLIFNCDPTYLNEANKWFTAVSLANNHTDNQGASGFRETQKQLRQHGIAYFGHYDPEAHDELCTVIAVGTDNNQTLPLALCGYHGVFKIPSESSLTVIKKYAAFMPVIAMPHMGVEYKTSSDPIREKTFRAMIDNGADAVIAAHPHWVQNSESYNGKPIFYSVGNFIFDQQANNEVTQSAPVAVTLNVGAAGMPLAQTWTQILKHCTADQTCLQNAEKRNVPKLPVTITYDVIPGDSSNRLTKKASPDTAQNVFTRLNWERTKQQLKSSAQ